MPRLDLQFPNGARSWSLFLVSRRLLPKIMIIPGALQARVASLSCDSALCLSRRWLHCEFKQPGSKVLCPIALASKSKAARAVEPQYQDPRNLSGCALFSDAELPQVVLQVQINNPRY